MNITDQYRIDRVGGSERRFIGEALSQQSAHADRNGWKRRASSRSASKHERRRCAAQHGGNQRGERSGKEERAHQERAPRPLAVDKSAECRRDDGEPGDVGSGGGPGGGE
jgi:hypothetical protein